MTNHEAIETLKANYPDACFEQLREAVDTAIFALQRSTHKALDTISRKAAIDAIMDADVCVTWNGVISEDDAVDIAIKSTKGSVISSIVNLPSAQPERKKGKWISRDGKDDCFECSECHAVIEGDEVYWRNNYFCYHCGADMRGEQDG